MISDVEISFEDIDWFAIDSIGEVAWFTSGAYGTLPASVRKSRNDLNTLVTFFEEHLALTTEGQIDSKAFDNVILASDTPEIRKSVFSENLQGASKGLYSYDSHDAEPMSGEYFRVSFPVQPITIEMLPEQIKNILSKTVLPTIAFRDNRILQQTDFINC
jgi:hypothetical protein